ncbi:bile acid-CoA:amino acid N-acyltransferase-like isoform X3 [Parambassis ranga]|uniref:Bile acid-CoA:amino acid N-acyltransferase-like isoform X3 n=1 Tax=Parambassis ranga TaxID=210632 RepID=A0A6P7I4I2_9TELE|nr:bile acid-CoA:amino acid N-acyltransferase-like isoform X3 [Parambassis ranga]
MALIHVQVTYTMSTCGPPITDAGQTRWPPPFFSSEDAALLPGFPKQSFPPPKAILKTSSGSEREHFCCLTLLSLTCFAASLAMCFNVFTVNLTLTVCKHGFMFPLCLLVSSKVTTDHSVGGSYLGCEPMGLFWGLQPAPGEREGLRLRKKNVEAPYTVHISLLEGHVSPSEGQTTRLATVTTERWYMAPGVKRIEIRQDGVVGTLFLPPGPGPFPAILDLWGMGGGLVEYRSALFASRGYASLSLAYFGHKELPGPLNRINVGDSYFKSAFHLLQAHSQPSCLICINGPVGSTSKLSDPDGKTKQFKSEQTNWTFDDQGYVSFRKVSLPSNLFNGSLVKTENLTCPLMYIVGEDDQSASSKENADLIEETLRSVGKSHLFTRLSYPGAGHLIEPPYSPNSRASLWSVKPKKLVTLWGGHLAPHAAAQEDSWRKILEFLESNLRV